MPSPRPLVRLLGLLLASCLAHAGSDVPAPLPSIADGAVRVDGRHLLTPMEDGGWVLRDSESGKNRALRLPAFHPERSTLALQGEKLAYVTLTRRGERLQLGCIAVDLAKGKVANREDTALLAPMTGNEAFDAPDISPSGQVSCRLAGERCKGANACTRAEETVNLSAHLATPAKAGRHGKGQKKFRGKTLKAPVKRGAANSLHHSHRKSSPKTPKKVRRK